MMAKLFLSRRINLLLFLYSYFTKLFLTNSAERIVYTDEECAACTEKRVNKMIRSGQNLYCKEKLGHYAEGFSELVKLLKPVREKEPTDRLQKMETYRNNENIAVVRSNLDQVSKIMTQLSASLLEDSPMEGHRFRYIKRSLRMEGILVEEARVFAGKSGKDSFAMLLWSKKRRPVEAGQVAEMLSVLLEKNIVVSPESPGFVTRIPRLFIFAEQAPYLAFTGFARAIKDKETVSGDNFSFLESGIGYLTAALSDGTGSGEEANRESNTALDLLDKFLEVNYPIESAIHLVNGIWTMGEESWHNPTLDICHINLNCCSCDFYKIGAPISYIKHKNGTELVEGSSMPMGCFEELQLQPQSFQLEPGDTVLLFTDGILDGYLEQDQEEAFRSFIEKLGDINPKEMAEKILQAAIYKCGGEINDDMSVLAVRLERRGTA